MTTCRAKFQCVSKTEHYYGTGRSYKFQAVYDQGLAEEDASFAKTTPSGSLEILVDNPNVEFELSEFYYLDFTKA